MTTPKSASPGTITQMSHTHVCWEQNLRGELFSSILRQPVEFFDEAQVGALLCKCALALT